MSDDARTLVRERLDEGIRVLRRLREALRRGDPGGVEALRGEMEALADEHLQAALQRVGTLDGDDPLRELYLTFDREREVNRLIIEKLGPLNRTLLEAVTGEAQGTGGDGRYSEGAYPGSFFDITV